jgi:Double zinc ribbon
MRERSLADTASTYRVVFPQPAGRCATLDDTRGDPSLPLRIRRMHCTKCGIESTTSRKFCAACGNPRSRKCPKCGAENAPSSAFCEDCGTALTPNAASASPSSPQSASTAPNIRVTPEQPDWMRPCVPRSRYTIRMTRSISWNAQSDERCVNRLRAEQNADARAQRLQPR